MNKSNGRIALFLALMLVLASGLSYLSFSDKTKEKKSPRTGKVMSVALVNEDYGTGFNNEHIGFGDAFVKSIERDDSHDWSVVSRSVAENGLKNNTYNLMVVIPSNFSEKALSINEKNPESVSLPYKINATGSTSAKAEAEEAAGKILNDFNRRVIDVYFASVVGNLQRAQDNVGQIVSKSEKYTNAYNQSVRNPLAGYTGQFKQVKDYTKQSKDIFSGFRKGLSAFDDQLAKDVLTKKDQLPTIANALAMKQDNQFLYLDYFQQMNAMNDSLYADPVGTMKETEMQNNRILARLQGTPDQPEAGMAADATMIQGYLKESQDAVKGLSEKLNTTVNEDIEKQVTEQLSDSFDEAFANNGMNLSVLFSDPDKKSRRLIEKHISKLPTLSLDEIDASGLSKETERRIRNTIATTKKYSQDFEANIGGGDGSLNLLPERIEKIKKQLASTGIDVSDTVKIDENENSGQTFKLIVPNGFSVTQLKVVMPGGTTINSSGTTISLPSNGAGQLKVSATFILNDENDQSLDLLKPLEWGWTLDQEDTGNAGSETASSSTTENMSASTKSPVFVRLNTEAEELVEQNEVDEEPNAEKQKESEEESEIKSEPKPDSDATEEEPAKEEKKEKDSEDKSDEKEEEPSKEQIEINNNTIRHKVQTPLFDESTNDVVKEAVDSLNAYEQLASLYESYFGLDMNSGNLSNTLEGDKLQNLATENSLYYLFNNKDIGGLFKQYAISQIADDLASKIKEPLEKLTGDIAAYNELVNQTDQQAGQLAGKIQAATEEALAVNEVLAQQMADAEAWRADSLKLLDNQTQVQKANEEEQTAMMALDGGFSQLLSSSESVAAQSNFHLSSAESVYSTFERIDNQASDIQKSGTGLVKKANDLSANMTDKVLKDKEFAHNFKNVLANSRVGDRQNENLFDFLSNPVQTKNNGTIFNDPQKLVKEAVPKYIVLIGFIAALFTAYAISTLKAGQKAVSKFESGEIPLYRANLPFAIIAASAALIEGLLMGVLSAYYLHAEQTQAIWWTIAIMLIMLAMVLIATYLLRQLKMIGMFILLAIFSIYLLLANSSNGLTLSSKIQQFSPLHYIEDYLGLLASGASDTWKITLTLALITLAGAALNLFVLNKAKPEITENEDVHEAI